MTTTKHMKLTMINEILRYNLYYFLIKFLLIKIQIIKFSNTFKQNSLGWLIMVVRNLTGQAQLFLNIFISWFCCLFFNGFTEEKLQLFTYFSDRKGWWQLLIMGVDTIWQLTNGALEIRMHHIRTNTEAHHSPSKIKLERIQKLIIHPARSN